MLRNLTNGAIAGALATAVYSAVLLAGERAGLLGEQPPKRITRTVLFNRPTRRRPGEGLLAAIAHFGFGSAAGAVLGLLSAGQRLAIPIGTGYGLAVWYAGYQELVPHIGAMPPATQDRPGRQAVLVAGHLVWGTALAIALNRLCPTRPERLGPPPSGVERPTGVVPAPHRVPSATR